MSAKPEWVPTAAAGWRQKLICNKEGYPRPLLANAITSLRESQEWAGLLAFNEFALSISAVSATPWGHSGSWDEQQDRLVTEWLQQRGIFVSAMVAGQAVETVARERSFHPVRQYLESLKWDGIKRLDHWMTLYLGVERSDYAAAVGARWLISAVARIFKPGVKVDCALVLEGKQGTLKSTALKTLAGDWFADELGEMGTKDAALQTCGIWILELSELEALNRSDVARAKSFISRGTDHFRPPYARRSADFPRQCVFAGTCNRSEYLRDSTGGRRFWPVRCGKILIDNLRRDRDQLWSEAAVRFRGNAIWWLDTPKLNAQAATEQDARFEADAWHELIEEWVENPEQCSGSVMVSDILAHCLGKPKDRWTQPDQNRVAQCLQRLGFTRQQVRVAGDRERREWRYRRAK